MLAVVGCLVADWAARRLAGGVFFFRDCAGGLPAGCVRLTRDGAGELTTGCVNLTRDGAGELPTGFLISSTIMPCATGEELRVAGVTVDLIARLCATEELEVGLVDMSGDATEIEVELTGDLVVVLGAKDGTTASRYRLTGEARGWLTSVVTSRPAFLSPFTFSPSFFPGGSLFKIPCCVGGSVAVLSVRSRFPACDAVSFMRRGLSGS